MNIEQDSSRTDLVYDATNEKIAGTNVEASDMIVPDLYFPMNDITAPIMSIGKDELDSTSTNGTPDFLQTGKNGFYAIGFDQVNNEYFDLGTSYDRTNFSNTSFSICFYVDQLAIPLNNSYVFHIKCSNGDEISCAVNSTISSQTAEIQAYMLGSGGTVAEIVAYNKTTTNTFGIVSVAITFDWATKAFSLYRNGVLAESRTHTLTSFFDVGIMSEFLIGTGDNTADSYNGKIQGFKTFNGKVLTLDEINKVDQFNYSGTDLEYQGNESLVLWNRLGSSLEIANSEIGPDGVETGAGGSFVAGKFGNAIDIPSFLDTYMVSFASSVLTKGTLEMWWKPSFNSSDVTTEFPYVANNSTGGSSSSYLYDQRSGKVGMLFYHPQSDGVGRPSKYTPTFTSGNWYHLAFVWDVDGIDGSSDHKRFYFDGVREPWQGGTAGAESSVPETDNISSTVYQSTLHLGNSSSGSRGAKASLDNVKYYNYAKTDFSDRIYEKPVNLKDLRM